MATIENDSKEENKESEKLATTPPKEKDVKPYLRAMPLRSLSDLESIKTEVNNGNILILRITPLANKNLEEVKQAVNDLYEFTESRNGDIARLGEERIVITPEKIKIWRDKASPSK